MVNYDFLSVYFYSVPNLRFEKFNNNWSRTTISKVCVCNPKNEDKLDDEFIYIDLESVEKGVLKSKNIIHLKNAPSRAQRILYKNDILFQSVRPYQRNNYLLNEDDDFLQYVASTGYIQLRTTLNPYFLFQLLNTDKINNEVMLRCTGTSYPAINSNDFSNILITITNDRNEQNKIAKFFSLIEERIQTQIKIIDSYFSLSKAISNTLIGQSKGNTRLRECLNCYSSNTMESVIKQEDLGDYPVYGANGIIKKINNYEIEYPSIAIVKDGSGVGKMFKLSGKYSILSTLNYLTSKPGYDIDYIYYALKQKSLKKYVVGSGIPHIYFKDYEQEKIYIPQNELQQQNITSVLQSIDEEIGNEIKQLKNYELLKKYLLKNMFV